MSLEIVLFDKAHTSSH